jgi:hypothetical protein
VRQGCCPDDGGRLTGSEETVTQIFSTWLVVLLAFGIANLPFVSQRLLGLIPIPKLKTLPIRLAELLVCYFVAGGMGLVLEQRLGQIAPQTWEFYAITGALFITFAFPGFVYRYLLKHSD